jgi:hypothetical protein
MTHDFQFGEEFKKKSAEKFKEIKQEIGNFKEYISLTMGLNNDKQISTLARIYKREAQEAADDFDYDFDLLTLYKIARLFFERDSDEKRKKYLEEANKLIGVDLSFNE